MERIKKIIVVLIIIVFLEGLAIITLYQRSQINIELIELLANRDITNGKLIFNLQKQISQK